MFPGSLVMVCTELWCESGAEKIQHHLQQDKDLIGLFHSALGADLVLWLYQAGTHNLWSSLNIPLQKCCHVLEDVHLRLIPLKTYDPPGLF